ncbi:geranylgeranyl pyrophosphate synthetase [Periconia macrospinosa]|uniref:geranylgeranyl diphosphate synthase n=1 Tax=Periconia macrospinosa TaxID=97972 RepID=A0A2V1DDC6_9PLEO|nr:geranylgeranyl pyrophosphate synthetase [Periconia macrospinosa]
MAAAQNAPEIIWVYSKPLDPDYVKKAGCFTSLPVRVHKDNHLADAATHHLATEWGYVMENGKAVQHPRLWSTEGDYSSFFYPECIPERLGPMAYLTELAFIHDVDIAEEYNYEGAMDEHNSLAVAMSVDDAMPVQTQRQAKMKKLLSKAILECFQMDKDVGLEIVDSYRKIWLVKMEMPNTNDIACLEDYIDFRRLNAGSAAYWTMVGFSHGRRYTKEDYEIMKDVVEAAERALIYINDYFSYSKEKAGAAKLPGGRIVNVVAMFMKFENLSEEDALKRARQEIINQEARFLTVKEEFYRNNPDVPFYLRQWTEVCGSVIGGSHFWSSQSPRYNFWKRQPFNSNGKIPNDDTQLTQKFRENGALDQNGAFNQHSKRKADCLDPEDPPQREQIVEDSGVKPTDSAPHRSTEVYLSSEALLAPCNYIKSLPSKSVRRVLIDAFNVWLEVPFVSLEVIKRVVDDLHTSSLILDDIQDDSPLRRGKTAAHLIFGTSQSINSATYMFVDAVQRVNRLSNPNMTRVLLEELENLFVGQSWDLNWKSSFTCPSEAEYLAMVDKKTGAMFGMLLRLMQAASPRAATYDLQPLAHMMGRWYQVRDDYMNLQGAEYSKQKGFCEDLDEGKISYPIVHCCNAQPTFGSLILGIFRQKQKNQFQNLLMESKMQILECLEKAGTFEATWDLITNMQDEIEEKIKDLKIQSKEENPTLRLLIKVLNVPKPGTRSIPNGTKGTFDVM